MMKPFTVTADDDGIRLDRWFKRHRADVPHALLQKLLRKGAVRLDGKKAETSTRVVQGQVVVIREDAMPVMKDREPKTPERYRVTEEDRRLMRSIVLYEDEDMFILNKPSGLAVQGGTGQSKSLDDMLWALVSSSPQPSSHTQAALKSPFPAEGKVKVRGEKPRLVHRLDQDTSGVLVVAKSAKSAATLAKLYLQRMVEKIYWALVTGFLIPPEGLIDLPMAKRESGKDSRMEKVEIDEDAGKTAKTRYKVLEDLGGKYAWVELEPITGRTHQLRVHMAAIEHPIVGDGKYGGKEAFIGGSMGISGKLHLHARSIELPGIKKVEAPLPPHMLKTWGLLGLED